MSFNDASPGAVPLPTFSDAPLGATPVASFSDAPPGAVPIPGPIKQAQAKIAISPGLNPAGKQGVFQQYGSAGATPLTPADFNVDNDGDGIPDEYSPNALEWPGTAPYDIGRGRQRPLMPSDVISNERDQMRRGEVQPMRTPFPARSALRDVASDMTNALVPFTKSDPQPLSAPPALGNRIGNAAIGGAAQTAAAMARPILGPEMTEGAAGYPQTYQHPGTWPYKIAGGVGSAVMMLPALPLGPAGVFAVGAEAGVGGGQMEIDRRVAAGEDVGLGAKIGIPLAYGAIEGATEMIGGRIATNVAPNLMRAVSGIIPKAATAVGVNVAGNVGEEVAAEVLQNATQQVASATGGVSGSAPGLTEGIGDAALGGLGGGLAMAPVSYLAERAQQRQQPTFSDAPPGAVPIDQPPAPPVQPETPTNPVVHKTTTTEIPTGDKTSPVEPPGPPQSPPQQPIPAQESSAPVQPAQAEVAAPPADDAMYAAAVAAVREANKGSVSVVQRELNLRYPDAMQLIDRMTADGILGPSVGPGGREVLPVSRPPQPPEQAAPRAKGPPLPLPPMHEDVHPPNVQRAWDMVSARYPKLAGMVKSIEPLDTYKYGTDKNASFDPASGVLRVNLDQPLRPSSLAHEFTHVAQGRRGEAPQLEDFASEEQFHAAVESPAYRRGETFKQFDESQPPQPAEQPVQPVARTEDAQNQQPASKLSDEPVAGVRQETGPQSRAERIIADNPNLRDSWMRLRQLAQQRIAEGKPANQKNLEPFAGEPWADAAIAARKPKALPSPDAMGRRKAELEQHLRDVVIRELGTDAADQPGTSPHVMAAMRGETGPGAMISLEGAIRAAENAPEGSPMKLVLHNLRELEKNQRGTKVQAVDTSQVEDGTRIVMHNEAKPLTIDREEGVVRNDVTAEIPDGGMMLYGKKVLPPAEYKGTLEPLAQEQGAGRTTPPEQAPQRPGSYRPPSKADLSGDSIDLWHGTSLDAWEGINEDNLLIGGERGNNASASAEQASQFPEDTGSEVLVLVRADPKTLDVDPNDQIGETVEEGLFPYGKIGMGSSSALGKHEIIGAFDLSSVRSGKYETAVRWLQKGDFEKAKKLGVNVLRGNFDQSAPATSGGKPFDADAAGVSGEKPGLFGQPTLDAATGAKQGGLFHEPTAAKPVETEKIKASAAAVDPENTPEMFPEGGTRNRLRPRGGIPIPMLPKPTPTQGQTFKLEGEEIWDKVRRVVQDEFLPLKRMQRDVAKGGGTVTEASDPYLKQELFRGRAANEIKAIEDAIVKPITGRMSKAGLSVADVDEYLYAIHAPERNAQIAKVNPKKAGLYADGSGMSDADAARVVAKWQASGKIGELDAIAADVHKLNDSTLDRMVNAGLLDQAAANAMRQTYQKYVPLRTDMEADGVPATRVGQGFNVRGKEGQRATGRESVADSPLTFSLMQAQEKVVRAEKNRVGQSLLKFVTDNPDPDLWTVNNYPTKPGIDPRTGLVTQQVDPLFQFADNVVAVKVDGKTKLIEFKGEAGKKIAASVKRLNYQDGGRIVQAMGKAMRGYAAMQTTLNPDFIVPNLIRDVQTASINLSSEQSAAMAGQMVKGLAKSRRAMWDVMGTRNAKMGSEYHDYAREYLGAGGKVDAYHVQSYQKTGKLISQLVEGPKTTTAKALFAARKAGEFVDRLNGSFEQATRLSAYVEARKTGMSTERAASLAKNLTVNFERKGEAGATINALYLFANANIQGNYRMIQAMAKSKTGRRIAGGIAASGLVYGMLAPLLFGDDEEGRKVWDTIPEEVKATNLLIPTGGAKYVKVPMPYGYNSLFAAGRLMGETVTGRMKPTTAMSELFDTTINAFNPLGNAGSKLQKITPTVLDPFVQASENKNWQGREIVPPQNPFGPPKPDSQLARRDTSGASRAVAEFLNRATGGDEVTSGKIDTSPATIDHFVGWATGGVGRFLGRTAGLPGRVAAGDVPTNTIPIVNRFVGEPPRSTNARDFYDLLKSGEDAKSDLKHYRQKGDTNKFTQLSGQKAKELTFLRWGDRLRADVKKLKDAGDQDAADERLSTFMKAYRKNELPVRWEFENEMGELRENRDAYSDAKKAKDFKVAGQLIRDNKGFARLKILERHADIIRKWEDDAAAGRMTQAEMDRRINTLLKGTMKKAG